MAAKLNAKPANLNSLFYRLLPRLSALPWVLFYGQAFGFASLSVHNFFKKRIEHYSIFFFRREIVQH